MATSSIIDHIRVNNPKVLELYVEALEKAEKEPIVKREKIAKEITDPEEMRQIMMRCIEKWGEK